MNLMISLSSSLTSPSERVDSKSNCFSDSWTRYCSVEIDLPDFCLSLKITTVFSQYPTMIGIAVAIIAVTTVVIFKLRQKSAKSISTEQ
jgi:hypothetical protein